MGTEPFKPWSKSVKGGDFSVGDPVVPKKLLPVMTAKSLTEMVRDFTFFTPAALYLFGGMTDEPLGDFRQQYGQPVDVFHFKFQHHLFRGLTTPCGDDDWNRVLWAVRAQFWPALRDFYLSIMLLSPQDKTASQVAYTEVDVVDSLALTNNIISKTPTISVAAFGIDGTQAQMAFKPSADPLNKPPRLMRYPPSEAMKRMAEVYAGRKS